MVGPDLQIRGEGHSHSDPVIRGGTRSQKKIFQLFGPQFGLKIRGGGGWAPRALFSGAATTCIMHWWVSLVEPGTGSRH